MANIKRPSGATKQRKRLGRGPGTGNGTTAGKGTKGQNSRSGGGVRPGFEGGQMPLYRRIARRGFSNYPFKVEYTVVNLSTLQKRYKSGETVDVASLVEKRVIKGAETRVKILGDGEIKKKLKIVGVAVSASARAKIEAAGGTIEGLDPIEPAEEAAVESAPVEAAEEAAPEEAAPEAEEAETAAPEAEDKATDEDATEEEDK